MWVMWTCGLTASFYKWWHNGKVLSLIVNFRRQNSLWCSYFQIHQNSALINKDISLDTILWSFRQVPSVRPPLPRLYKNNYLALWLLGSEEGTCLTRDNNSKHTIAILSPLLLRLLTWLQRREKVPWNTTGQRATQGNVAWLSQVTTLKVLSNLGGTRHVHLTFLKWWQRQIWHWAEGTLALLGSRMSIAQYETEAQERTMTLIHQWLVCHILWDNNPYSFSLLHIT